LIGILGVRAMCGKIAGRADGILDVADGHMKAAQAKWSRLTGEDLSGIRNKQDLVLRVEELRPAPLAGGAGRGALAPRR